MAYTTRRPPYKMEKVFPFLKGKGRKAVRLHPRREAGLAPTISKIGGAIVWPADEPKPECPITGCHAVPVIQLLRQDFREVEFEDDTDIFQLLWYPRSYADWEYKPRIEVRWRHSEECTSDSVFEPNYENAEEIFIVHECRIHPETVVEYPYIDLLTDEEMQEIWSWEEKQNDPLARYQYCLSVCPGTKIGGYPQFAGQDAPSILKQNGSSLHYMLTLTDAEWDGGSFPRWRPVEQQAGTGDSDESISQYHAAQCPLGTYLKLPSNIFFDKSIEPWECRVM